MEFENIVVYENMSDNFCNGHCRINVKVTVGLISIFLEVVWVPLKLFKVDSVNSISQLWIMLEAKIH